MGADSSRGFDLTACCVSDGATADPQQLRVLSQRDARAYIATWRPHVHAQIVNKNEPTDGGGGGRPALDAEDAHSRMAPMHDAACCGDRALVAVLVAAGATVDLPQSATGRTPLIFASELGLADTVELLLDAGADPRRTDRDGLTARARAVAFG
jgi:hypothetical protein